jgi:hypothetical protein
MSSFIFRLKSEEGYLTIIAFVLLVVLTVIGVFATKTAQIDLQTAYNEIPYKQNFYVAEGGVNQEAAVLGSGDSIYAVTNVNQSQALVTNASRTLPELLNPYVVTVRYLGYYAAPSGYSALHFNRYDYYVDARAGGTATSGQVRVASRLYKIGPKAE